MNNLLERRSLPLLTIDKYRNIFTFPVKDYYIKAGHDFSDESFEKIGKEFMDEYELRKYECNLYPFALKVLEKFKSKNVNQYLLSAYKQESLLHIIEKYNIKEYFSEVYGLDHIYADGKLELGMKLMKRISTNGKDGKVLLIGDTVHDFEVARLIGSDCLLIAGGHQDGSKLKGIGCEIIESMEKLYQIMRETEEKL